MTIYYMPYAVTLTLEMAKGLSKDQSGFHLRELVIIILVLLVIVFIGWRVLKIHHKSSTSTPAAVPSTNPNNQLTSAKSAPMQGILNEGTYSDQGGFSIPASPWDQAFNGIIVHVHWADLQPTQGGPISSNNLIDQAITAVQSYNSDHPSHQFQLKIRVFAGIYAPEWAKTLGGFSPVPMLHGQYAGKTIGPFWRSDYLAAYQDLENKLAAKYDSQPLIHDVTMSACMTIFAEPLDWGGFDNFGPLFSQGFTNEARANCFMSQIDAHKAWKYTHSSVALNPYQPVVFQNGKYSLAPADLSVTSSVMSYCRTTLGSLCVLENNSVRQSFIGKTFPLTQMYQSMKQFGPDITFQTAVYTGVGNLDQVIHYAAGFGANAVEIPSEYPSLIIQSQLVSDNQLLLSNPVK